MTRAQCSLCVLLLLCPLALSRHDDDFAFDNEEFQVELQANHSEIEKNGLRRLWGVPDTSAYVGHLFRMEIPKEAFTGDVQAYKVRSEDGRRMPSWLAVDSRHGLISGIPQSQDVGAHSFTVTAHGRTAGLTAQDEFTIEVKKAEDKPQSKYGICNAAQNKLVLMILLDQNFHHISSRQRIRALMELANFMALDGDEFSIAPYKVEVSMDQTVLMSGPGTTQRRRGDATTAIYLNVGCGDKLWSRHKVLVAGLREQSRDGTLAHLLKLPVLGWRLLAVKPAPRLKRQLPVSADGSGDYYDNEDDADADYSGYGDDEDDEYDDGKITPFTQTEAEDKVKIVPYSESASEGSNINETRIPSISPRIFSFDGFDLDSPTTTEAETQTVIIRETNNNEIPTPSSTENPPSIATPLPTRATEVTTPTSTSVVTTPSTTTSTSTLPPPPVTLPPTTPSTVPTTPSTTPVVETTLLEVTSQETYLPSEKTSPISGQTTETVTFPMPTIPMPVNQPPTLKHHMKKLAITAGKAFRYIIPADLFTDPEDGSDLVFTVYEADNVPLNKNSWIQFMPAKREVYGLPLESHVSRWNYIVEAKDQDGDFARGPLDITVQQHRGARTVNHQFVLQFKLNKEFQHGIDWQISALEGIVNLFRDTDMDHLTVLNATQNGDLCEFVWTNDTLPKDPACPMDDINRLMKIMESDSEAGSPSAGLARAMSPDLKVSSVKWRGVGACAGAGTTQSPATKAPDTYPPVTRNQVDILTATQGHLLVYKVPEDTFFDPEDGGTRNLQLSLRYSDRSALPPGHWLQFDANNQEFYGLPGPGDVGSTQYQLVAEDSSKKSAYDSLIVEVVKAPSIRPTVEFQMTMEYPFPMLAYNAHTKRKVVEKLAALFGQSETGSIRIQNISDNPTTITWYNTSLPMDRCPEREIEELRKMIIVDERNLRENVDQIFDKDFKVMSIRLILLGLCAEQNTKTPSKPMVPVQGTNRTMQRTGSVDGGYTEYLVTFIIPAVAIVCMILIAGIIACVLYKRRRTGKMSVGDEEERQAFRSKGIPVIFQDELEEQAGTEPLHKSPVIMREEKPPLLPPAPDYRNSAPYRPPPPVAPATTPPRPKATPTYRKPPPYVPP